MWDFKGFLQPLIEQWNHLIMVKAQQWITLSFGSENDFLFAILTFRHHHHPHERCLLTRLQWCFHWLRYFPCPFWKPEPESLWPRLGPTASIHGARFHTKCQWAWNFASGAEKERSLNSYMYIPTFLEFHLMEKPLFGGKKIAATNFANQSSIHCNSLTILMGIPLLLHRRW